MKILDLGEEFHYRYRVNVPFNNSYHIPIDTITEWATDNEIDCVVIPGCVFFTREKDMLWFILSWQ
jgi:hypothetical protein